MISLLMQFGDLTYVVFGPVGSELLWSIYPIGCGLDSVLVHSNSLLVKRQNVHKFKQNSRSLEPYCLRPVYARWSSGRGEWFETYRRRFISFRNTTKRFVSLRNTTERFMSFRNTTKRFVSFRPNVSCHLEIYLQPNVLCHLEIDLLPNILFHT